MLSEPNLLENFGGLSQNNLLHLLSNECDVDDEILNIDASPYYSHDTICDVLKSHSNKFSILSLNCQSINAKFSKLQIFLDELKLSNFEFSAVCLQETWLKDDADLSLLQLRNYQCIYQGKHCSHHGGLMIYLHNKYSYSIHIKPEQSDLWEGLFIRIDNQGNGKNIDIGNIYRPPKDNNSSSNVSQFTQELSPVLEQMTNSNSHCILLGDFNINLLNIK